ncbi:unnamed protein product [Kluyveromyces dobzhanskii CBS 2104]|uniref:WGS project CCBQ000000000 data, contig 00014 n=1 Tax=Kluyveromyces dobzhanskii CBS 2104 TaxID=1427455 RepID=A0A0A8L9C2_9SACH|nr:unnamed protein product [Kluyveromyces dobzhanskii CBS 2104]
MSQQRVKVWVPDEREVFVQGQLLDREVVKNKQGQEQALVLVNVNGKEVKFAEDEVAAVNPSTFDKVDDLSELTHLNEASVLFNLENRYQDGLIYTYSGLFLVAINPYSNVKLYNESYIKLYHGSPKEDNKPHIFAVAEQAYQNLLHQKQDQSILVTGESGAGKTENTKKILQYLASITTDDKILFNQSHESFERKILQSNPILESFGNAQTVRNNNSSRFGKFIKIDFDEYGKINGAHIEWYLLEKSRVIQAHAKERNYHIFYQLLSGMSKQELRSIELESSSVLDYEYLRHSNPSIPGVDDSQNYQELISAFDTVGFSKDEILSIFKCISLILHIGNVKFVSERSDQAAIKNDVKPLCKLLGVKENDFKSAVLKPRSKAGKEWVSQSKNASQSRSILNSLSRSLYEKLFEYIVNQINKSLEHGSMTEYFIGLLDIAGFEIFKDNSFEQLCINYTNEKLQQFFNHHMFVLEQNEYQKEDIQWNFVDYGKDSQTTIDLIEQKNDIPGILPILEEESILPKSSDESFYSKLISSWEKKSTKFKRSKLDNCFILKHYAGDVEYNVTGWLLKNKDPLNENLLQVLNDCTNPLVSQFFSEQVRGSSFRTSSSKQREQLNTLIDQLGNTDPHFIRCIIPNNKKKAGDFDKKLILDQLRCNGVLEGIRIARDGYPNRIFFKEFFQRYKILSDEYRFTNNSKKNCEILLSSLHLDPAIYKIGNTKLFFKAGVLANLELLKEERLSAAVTKLNSIISGNAIRVAIEEHLKKLQAARVLKVTFETYERLMENPWYNLYMKLLPLLDSSNNIVKTKKIAEQVKLLENKLKESENDKAGVIDAKALAEKELDSVRVLLSKETGELQKTEKLLESAKTKQVEIEQKWNETLLIKTSLETKNTALSAEADKLRLLLDETKNASNVSQDKFNSLSEDKEKLEIAVRDLKTRMDQSKQEERELDTEKDSLKKQIDELKKEVQEKTVLAKDLETKLGDSEIAIDIKLKELQSSLSATTKRMRGFVDENTQLVSQLSTLNNKLTTKTNLLRNKSEELDIVNDKINSQEAIINSLSSEKDSLLLQVSTLSKELKAVRHENDCNRKKLESIQEEYSIAAQASKERFSRDSSHEVEELKTDLLKEQSINKFLNERLVSVGRSGKAVSGFSVSLNTDDLRKEFDNLSMKYKDVEIRLTNEIEEKKNLISRLRFAETRLASASFDNQTLVAQLKKIKEFSKSSLSEIDFDKELENIDNFEINQEKMLLEIDFLKKQLSKEMNSRKNAERVAGALHQKVGQIQRSDSSADIFKLRYEANEDYVKSLESRQNHLPLRDTTNITNGDIFKHRESFEKYEEELQRYKVETNRMHSSLADYQGKLHDLTLNFNKSLVTESSLREQITQLEDELKIVEDQKNMIQSDSKRYQAQYKGSQRDLIAVESELRTFKHCLKQAEKDIESMTEIIGKLRAAIKQSNQDIWKQDNTINELNSQLDEKTIELDKCVAKNSALEGDIQYYKERARAVETSEEYLAEIESLKGRLDGYLRLETELKKEISNLGYQLETLKLESEAKIQDLLKQTAHYESLVTELGIQKDEAEAAKKTLETTIKTLEVKVTNLEEISQSLSSENGQLQKERTFLRSKLDEANSNFSQSLKEKAKYSHDVQFLEESLALQKQQTERNEELTSQLQSELDEIKESLSAEKDKNANLHAENVSLGKANEILRTDLVDAQNKLADTSEHDAWFNKTQTLTTTLEEERTLKFEEIKKSKKLERIIEELQNTNEEQANVIEMANTAREQYEKSISQLDQKLAEIEATSASKDATLNKLHRENKYCQEQVSELEKEIESWKQRYEKLSERRKSVAQSTDAVFI